MPKWFSPFSFKKRKKGEKKKNFHTATCTNRGSILGLGRQLGPQTAGPRAGGTRGLPGVPFHRGGTGVRGAALPTALAPSPQENPKHRRPRPREAGACGSRMAGRHPLAW